MMQWQGNNDIIYDISDNVREVVEIDKNSRN